MILIRATPVPYGRGLPARRSGREAPLSLLRTFLSTGPLGDPRSAADRKVSNSISQAKQAYIVHGRIEGLRGLRYAGCGMVSNLGGRRARRGRTTLATNETFCTECQRVAYIADGARLECPVCSSPLLAPIEEEA